MLIVLDLKTEAWPKRSVYWFDQYFFYSRLDNNHQYLLDGISILGAFILNAAT